MMQVIFVNYNNNDSLFHLNAGKKQAHTQKKMTTFQQER